MRISFRKYINLHRYLEDIHMAIQEFHINMEINPLLAIL
ncbi:hypothetical protein DSBG_1709 [Desulfosporosinus sp. BG]|nr:hypothetical protein DSBG_1709 [Desulfosporosinus sp. BG]